MSAIIQVTNLSKSFIISHEGRERYTALRDVVTQKAKKIFSFPSLLRGTKQSPSKEEFWALKDVTFDIEQGDRVGIIGRNGAGKSTLLKILSRITEPTQGEIRIKGRVASLLEVGTGFHPELTGRENIFLNGAILGMSRAEIRKKFDEIVDFAEVEKFLDTPVKRYSSGMYVRLAFAVAAHLEPEILIVDEVLAVGDAQFQKKCLGKMQDVSKNEGRTVLLVSHNIQAIQALCKVGILLQSGKLKEVGNIEKIIECYFNQDESNTQVYWNGKNAPGNKCIKIMSIRAISNAEVFYIDKEIEIEIIFKVLHENVVLNHSLALFKSTEEHIFSSPSLTDIEYFQKSHKEGVYKVICKIPEDLLNVGEYYVSYLLVGKNFEIICQLERVITIKMEDNGINRGNFFGQWSGLTRPKLLWETILE